MSEFDILKRIKEIERRLEKMRTFDVPKASSSGGGDVLGPATSTDGHLAVWDGTNSKTLKDGGAPGGGAVATDTIWDAAGDIVQGTGANAAARLAKGTEGRVLKAGASAVEWGGLGFAGVQLLRTVVGAGGAASIDLSSISAGYDIIKIFLHGKSEAASGAAEFIKLTLNNDTTDSNYFRQRVSGASTTASANFGADRIIIHFGNSQYATITEITIVHPDSSFNKNYYAIGSCRTGAEAVTTGEWNGDWSGTAAINRITLTTNSGSDFAEGTLCVIVGYKNFA